jgi:predicted regulator of Ras-like GTPase activity (Roadblock/LC7/MglB family)
LRELRANNPDIGAAVLATEDGFPVAADAVPEVNTDLLSALAADLLMRAARSAKEFGQGDLNEIYAHGSAGYVIVARAGAGQVLACLASGHATLGLLLVDVRRTANKLAHS